MNRTPRLARARRLWSIPQAVLSILIGAALLPLSYPASAQNDAQPFASGSETGVVRSSGGDFDVQLVEVGIDSADTDALMVGLVAAKPLTRAASAWALTGSSNPQVIDALVQAGYDQDALVREWAVRALVTRSEQ